MQCTVTLRDVEGDEMGTQRMGVKLGHAVTGGHKHRDLVLQIGGWTLGSRHFPVKKNIVTNSEEVKNG
jgi:hypothetical protein